MNQKSSYEELEKKIRHWSIKKKSINEAFMCYLYQRAPLSYQSLDEKGNFIDVNDTWLCLMGYEAYEVIGKNFSEFLHPDWKDHFKENFPRLKRLVRSWEWNLKW